ncbi:MAG TPA: DedA family protein [Tepidisphaeraceae bacterium]|nr:DedA family protein [Tepidisphaeraceae bacterium]
MPLMLFILAIGLSERLGHWIHHAIVVGGYPALFGLLFACGLGLMLPEDVPLITAGVLIQHGQFHWAIAAICAWFGIIGGDCVLYSLGRKFGHDVSKIPVIGRHVNPDRMARVEHWFAHWGVWVVVIGRMFAGVRGAMVVVAGATRFPFWKFLIADGLAAVVSGGIFIMLGYTFASNMHRLREMVDRVRGAMLLGTIVLVILIVAFVVWHNKRKREPGKKADELPATSPGSKGESPAPFGPTP